MQPECLEIWVTASKLILLLWFLLVDWSRTEGEVEIPAVPKGHATTLSLSRGWDKGADRQ